MNMRFIPRFAIALIACGGVFACDAAGQDRRNEPYATRWLDSSGLVGSRFGEVAFETRDGQRLKAFVYRATRFDPASGSIWFVMHGAGRNADDYLKAAAPVAERHDALAIAIEFSKRVYPRQEDYMLDVAAFAEVEYVFDAVREVLGGRQDGYYLFGHSAGAQFVHRLMTFLPDARVLGAVAANAGWYTLPVSGREAQFAMPYGLAGSALERSDVRWLFRAPLTVLLGERDTETADADRLLRGTAEAMAQGRTRLARGQHYFATARSVARRADAPFTWRLAIVPRAAHEVTEIMPSAGFFLFQPNEAPCAPSAAADVKLVIDAILADPPDGARGDTNGDGMRDPADDEFVEIVNAGTTPACLAGWTLGDASQAERHVFPLGGALPPGRALLVFGGGVPTGRFGGAMVQWAAFGGQLNLSNAGDVLTLRDAAGTVAKQVSWGDCDGAPCSRDHRTLREDGRVLP
jgi:hypothetical protein